MVPEIKEYLLFQIKEVSAVWMNLLTDFILFYKAKEHIRSSNIITLRINMFFEELLLNDKLRLFPTAVNDTEAGWR